ncbi:choline ABC transporter permease subunit [Lentibacter algarum]|uniref:choline ABC transporter permease subunit n=1 Tax=Lentibacter algarum TaxID=576131 RepID=UPI001C07283D|nr:choline ABC transporter permease subunit [Lentibacter algarum]MBU2980743.1 choline ABC transporter permease subunit [Lentibacter algarum]
MAWNTDWIKDDGKILIGKKIAAVFDWMTEAFGGFFDLLETVLSTSIDGVLAALQFPPSYLMVALFAALTWLLQRSPTRVIIVSLCFLYTINQGYWEEVTESLALILFAGVFCMGVGIPVGIYAAHRPKVFQAILPVLDMMQTIPTFVYLIPMIVLFGIGMVPGLVATFIFVLAAPIRLTQLGVSSTPVALIEAAEAFGATKRQLLWKVELPSALPQIMAGLNQTIMLSLSMVVIAALVGADGLGVPVVRALNSVNAGLGFESGLVIVAVAIALDRMLRVEAST